MQNYHNINPITVYVEWNHKNSKYESITYSYSSPILNITPTHSDRIHMINDDDRTHKIQKDERQHIIKWRKQ